MYKSDYFTKEQMTKYEILLDSNKVWDKTLAHFTDLFSLRKAYGDKKAATSGFESAAHIHDHSSAHSIITANTESDLTRDLYIKSLEESLAAAWENYALDATTRTPVPPTFNPLTLLQETLAEQRKQVSEIMAQNAKLIATLSKGGGGNSGSSGKGKGNNGDNCNRHKTPWKEKNSALTATKKLTTIPRIVSPSRPTRTNAPRDGALNAETGRDRGPTIKTQHYGNELIKINLHTQ
jgi:hypothetical protein